jgi:PAB-dependent poly(A)-specific ribonuclease subunit 2
MPNHREDQLLSNIPKDDYTDVTSPFFNLPEQIPASVLTTMKMVDFVGYATMPRELRGHRNVVKAGPGAAKRMGGKYARRESAPRFRSDKDRDKADAAAELGAEVCCFVQHDKGCADDLDYERHAKVLQESRDQVLQIRRGRL